MLRPHCGENGGRQELAISVRSLVRRPCDVERVAIAAGSHVLRLLAALNEHLVEHAIARRARPEVARVARGADVRLYESGSVLDLSVDAELRNGRALTWWVDVRPEEEILAVSTRVLRMRDSDQEVVLFFSRENAQDMASLAAILASTGDQVRRSIDLVASERTSP